MTENSTLFHDRPLIQINNESMLHLQTAGKWGYFLSIMGFIFVGLIAIFGLFMGAFLSSFSSFQDSPFPFPTAIFSVVYLLMALLYFFPTLYLYRFSVRMKRALVSGSQDEATSSFANLGRLFRFWGILTIIVLALYAVVLIFALIMGVSQMSSVQI